MGLIPEAVLLQVLRILCVICLQQTSLSCNRTDDRLCGLVARVLANPEIRVRFPALPDFLRSSASGTG
jgi:hypothetical protein